MRSHGSAPSEKAKEQLLTCPQHGPLKPDRLLMSSSVTTSCPEADSLVSWFEGVVVRRRVCQPIRSPFRTDPSVTSRWSQQPERRDMEPWCSG